MSTERTMFRAAVFVVVRDSDGKVLLHRRKNTGYMDGYYDFPSGHVDASKSFRSATVRELAEETGLTVDEKDLRLKHLNINSTSTEYINVVFETSTWQGKPQIMEADKCDDMGFFAVTELPAKCSLAVRYVERSGFDTFGDDSYIDTAAVAALTGYAE